MCLGGREVRRRGAERQIKPSMEIDQVGEGLRAVAVHEVQWVLVKYQLPRLAEFSNNTSGCSHAILDLF